MAEEAKAPEKAADKKTAAPKGGGKKLFWIVLVVVVGITSGAGFGLGKILAGPQEASAAMPADPSGQEGQEPAAGHEEKADEHRQTSYINLDTIIANLDDPRLARYVRVTITLSCSKSDSEAVQKLIDSKKPEVNNWLYVYLAGCTLEDVRGAKNVERVRRELTDLLNKRLWPDSKPLVDVLFKDIAVQ